MKIKQKRNWCLYSNIRLPSDYKPKYYRCQCGKRMKVLPFLDWPDAYTAYDRFTGKPYLKTDTLWKYIAPHKTKVKYKNEN